VVFYILIVAVFNLALGFAIALHLGRKYRELVVQAAESTVPSGTSVGWSEPLPEPAEEEVLPVTTSADPPADEEDAAKGEAPPDATPEPDAPQSPAEAATADLRSEVERYHLKLTRLDDALRDCAAAPDATSVRSCVASLRETNNHYRVSREKAYQAFQEMHQPEEGSRSVNEELRAVVARQDAQLDETENVFRDLDCETDPKGGRRQVAEETSKLLEVNHDLRDRLDQISAVAARNDRRPKALDRAKLTDPLTELANRAGLEACLADWWDKDPHRVRQLNAAMIDMDEMGRLNERWGQDVGDRVLRATARILTAESRNHLIAARYSGQRFVLLFPDVDLRFATNLVERIRQTVELTLLKDRGEDVRVTVSCAVTEIRREETPETLYARAEATLHEAKRYGRNRTFFYEGKYPTPVVPPNFSLEEKFVML
jgi:diguanylate cyclase (GGDEF)-like protein